MAAIEVQGALSCGETATVTVYGHQRIAAVLTAAQRHLTETDQVTVALVEAVTSEVDAVCLPDMFDKHDADVMAQLLEDVRNGDDNSAQRAAGRLRKLTEAKRRCPMCDGEGEVAA